MKRRTAQQHQQGRERFRAALKITDKDAAAGTFSGYASVFKVPIDTWPPTVIEPGAFKATLGNKADRDRVRILWQHRVDQPIGVPTDLAEDKEGLRITGRLSDTQLGRDARTLLEDGVVREMSIGFDPVKWTMQADPTAPKDPDKFIRHLSEVKLWEVSLVTFGANREAVVYDVHAAPDGVALDPLRAWHPTEALARVRTWAGWGTPGLEGASLRAVQERYARAFLVNTLGRCTNGDTPEYHHLIGDVQADGTLVLHPTAVLVAGTGLVRDQFAGTKFTPEAKRAMRDAVGTLTSLLAGADDDDEGDEDEEDDEDKAAPDKGTDKGKPEAEGAAPGEGNPCGGKKQMGEDDAGEAAHAAVVSSVQAELVLLEAEAALLGVR